MQAHLFDLDHTLIKENCCYQFGAYLYRKKAFSFTTMLKLVASYLLHKAGFLSMTRLHQHSFNAVFRGKNQSEMTTHLEDFLKKEWQPYLPAIERLRLAQKQGHYIALLSSSPDFLVQAIAKKLEIKHWKATTYTVNDQNVFAEVSKVFQGSDKAAYIKPLNLYVTAYSDSHLDIPFLQAANCAIAVNPTSRLLKHSHRLGWEII